VAEIRTSHLSGFDGHGTVRLHGLSTAPAQIPDQYFWSWICRLGFGLEYALLIIRCHSFTHAPGEMGMPETQYIAACDGSNEVGPMHCSATFSGMAYGPIDQICDEFD